MHRGRYLPFSQLVLPGFLFLIAAFARAENVRPLLITQNIDEAKLVTLAGNTRPQANAKNDRGAVPDSQMMEHLQLLLKRSPLQEQELQKLIDDLHDSSSPSFHQWLTANEFGERFGVAVQDRETIKSWLQSHGLKVNVDYTNGLLIDFSGTAGQIREAFHTEIHSLEVKGVRHFANMSDPKIPVALAPAIEGVVALHDFAPHSLLEPRPQYTVTQNGTKLYLVTASDLETIYNLNPLFTAGISGQGQTIALIEDTDVYTADDWTSFRSIFGLSAYTDGSLTPIHPAPPSGTNNCTDPGANGDDREAIVDAEYASAVAPSATLEIASCANSGTFGGLIAVENLLNQSAGPPAIMSISYGECEAQNGSTSNAAFNSTYQQAVAEGVSVFVASGDHAGAFCDYYDAESQFGIGVNGWGSSPYNVSVGGTDFGDTYAKTNSTYWKSTNSSTYESAKSYIPEIPWNNSCASSLIAENHGYSQTYGTSGFCNSTEGELDYLTTWGGGGGPSGCATGTSAVPGVVGGTCAGWPKPSYQSLLGNPSDGVRDLPDLSLFAANGVWQHYYVYCFSGPEGVPCTEAPVNWPGAGGTSFSSPIMAAIQALVNQKAGGPQGNPNYVYYSLAATQYGTTGDKTCNSTLGKSADSGCIFYDVTQGDNDVDCVSVNGLGADNCYLPSGDYGVLSTSASAFQPAFAATTGWDFATGIGTVNATNLVNNWPAVFTVAAIPATVSLIQGGSVTTAINITASSGFSGDVTLSAAGMPDGVTASFSPNGINAGASTLTLKASATAATGTALVNVTGTSGSLSQTIAISVSVTPAAKSFTLLSNPTSLSVVQGSSGTSTITVNPINGFSGKVTLSASGLPTGVTASFSPSPATTTSTLTLAASATATTGTATVTVTGTSGSLTQSTTIALTITPAPTFTLSASPSSATVVQGSTATSTLTITPANGFNGSVSFSASGLPSGVTAAFSPNPATSISTLTFTASASATAGTATVSVTGTSGSLTETTTINLTVNAAPSFALSASPSTLTVVEGTSGSSTITITPANGFNGTVALSASGLPSGVTASFSPNPAGTTSTLTLSASSTATKGTATVTVTGTSGSLTQTTTISLTVTASASYTISASPSTLSVVQGSTGTSTVTITPSSGFSGNVTLAASGLPSGVTASFSPNPATTTSTLTFTASATAATGTATVTVTGTSGSITQTTTISLTVTTSPSYTISASPTSLSVVQGTSGTSAITITPSNGFGGSVTLSASGLPSGVTASFSPNPASTTSTLTFTASAAATTGAATVTITGTSGSITQTTTISLTVTAAPTYSLSASPSTLSIVQGTAGTSTITITPANGFNGNVSLSTSGLPSGVTASFSPNPATSSSTLTLTASASATAGTATVTVTGKSGSLTQTTTVSLTVTLAQSFNLSTSPTTLTVTRGAAGSKSTVTIVPVNGFSGSVTLAASGLPTGVTAAFSVNPATKTSVVTLTASKTASTGTFTVTITGTSGSLSATTTISVTIPVGNFSLTASPATITVPRYTGGQVTITVVPTQGFNQSVALSASGTPPNTKALFSPTSTAKTSTMTLSASGNATPGQYTITVTGTSGSLTHTTTVTMTIQ